MVKGCRCQTSLDNKPLPSGSGVPVPVMSWTFGSTGVGDVETLFPGAAGGHSSSLCNMILLHDLRYWSVISEKQLSVSLNRIGLL